jgi:hypothetical protein
MFARQAKVLATRPSLSATPVEPTIGGTAGGRHTRSRSISTGTRRGRTSDYTIEIGAAPARDALVPATPYHAIGPIECTFGGDSAVKSCEFGVIRKGGSSATLDVTLPDGPMRTLFFKDGKVSAGAGDEVTTRRKATPRW